MNRFKTRTASHSAGTLQDVLGWINPCFGPIKSISATKCAHPHPAWWIYCAQLSRNLGSFFSDTPVTALGSSIDQAEALQRVLGESIERYCVFNSTQWSDLALTGGVTHTPVVQLKDAKECWLPASSVHLGFQTPANERLAAQPLLSGSAFHTDITVAVFAGLCEVAERDAIMRFWCNRTPLKEIDVYASDIPPALAFRLRALDQVGLSARFFDLSTEFNVPAVFCLLIGSDYPFYCAGSSCQSAPCAAIAKSLDEAVMIRYKFATRKNRFVVPSFESFDWIKTLEDHSSLYAAWKNCSAFDFLFSSQESVSYQSFAAGDWYPLPRTWADLEQLSSNMESLGFTVLWTDITAPEAVQFGRCVKVIVPEMIPISVRHETGKYPHPLD